MKVRQEVYDTYWKTAAERQHIFFKKFQGIPAPYTLDPIFQTYKFCNVYRATDRVSQFLIKNVIYNSTFDEVDTLFRILLFRLLNKNETWEKLESILGEITLKSFSFEKYAIALEQVKSINNTIYGNAFILCATKAFGYDEKHKNHLALLEYMFKNTKITSTLIQSESLEKLFHTLKSFPLLGDFMAYQVAIDFNYSDVFNFDENDFTVAGPGAIRGIKKCFVSISNKSYRDVIMHMVENQEKEFDRLELNFKTLWGRPMHAIDCQGWFCETDKYTRISHPGLKSNRSKMKSIYTPTDKGIKYFFPPKWKVTNK